MTETIERVGNAAILYDKAIISQISPAHFTPQGWPHSEPLQGELGSGGRGNTLYVGNIPRQFVLRHYMRGGLLGKLIRDTYFFKNSDHTRSFKEWRLLDKLSANNLNVPRPAAARYVQYGTFYTADIITVRIPDVVPLSIYIARASRHAAFWEHLGAAIWTFHKHGVFHADMNAYNIQVDGDGDVWMLDFDKGELRRPGAWQQQTLQRLHRSLNKIVGLDPRLYYSDENWEQLLSGYFKASKPA